MYSQMKTVTLTVTAAAALAAAVVGCDSNPREVSSDKSITSMSIDYQNFQNAAREVTEKMLTNPRVQQALAQVRQSNGGRNPRVQIDEIENRAGVKVNLNEFMIAPIEETFINNGAFDFVSGNQLSSDIAGAQELKNHNEPKLPDVVMHGVVSKLSTHNSDMAQNVYQFDVRLSDTHSDTTIFTGLATTLPKQQKKQGLGW